MDDHYNLRGNTKAFTKKMGISQRKNATDKKLPIFTLGTIRQFTEKHITVSFDEFWEGINRIFK